jgi:hypothetical protein
MDDLAWSAGDDFDRAPTIPKDPDGTYHMPAGLVGYRVRAMEQPADDERWLVSLVWPGGDPSKNVLLRSAMDARSGGHVRTDPEGKVIRETRLIVEGATVPIEVKAKAI